MSDTNAVGKLAELYQRHPYLQALAGLVPGSGALDPLLQARAEQIAGDRAHDFFKELTRGGLELTPELIDSDEFLHAYFSTMRAVVHTRRRQKIRYFARLFRSALLGGEFRDSDDYEELLGILDDLSFRELIALAILDRHASSGDMTTDTARLDWRNRIRQDFVAQLGLDEAEIPGFLGRLQRSGLFVIPGFQVSDEGTLDSTTDKLAGLGELTPRFSRFKQHIGTFDIEA